MVTNRFAANRTAGAKAPLLSRLDGTAKAMPFPKTFAAKAALFVMNSASKIEPLAASLP